MERRAFVQTLGAAALTASVTNVARAAGATSTTSTVRPLPRTGIQLYAVRDSMRKDVPGTLAALRQMGYTEVESLWSFGNWGRSPKDWRALLDANGLRSP